MAFDYERIEEGQTILASVFADQITLVQNRVNNLPSTSVELHSLTREHLPSPVVDFAHKVLNPGVQHSYNDDLDGYPGWGVTAGWTIINTDGSLGTGTLLEAEWQVEASEDLSEGHHKILILLNVHLIRLEEMAGPVVSNDYFCIMAIQAQDLAGTWFHITRSERYCDAESWTNPAGPTDEQLPLYKDFAIRTMLTQADCSASGLNIQNVAKVRAVVAVVDSTATHGVQLVYARLREANLTAIAFRAGDL